jgi:predicted nucleic acid-binding protein
MPSGLISFAAVNSTLMKHKVFLTIIIAGAVGLAFMLWTADMANKKSDQIMDEFKVINSGIDESNHTLMSRNDSIMMALQQAEEADSMRRALKRH